MHQRTDTVVAARTWYAPELKNAPELQPKPPSSAMVTSEGRTAHAFRQHGAQWRVPRNTLVGESWASRRRGMGTAQYLGGVDRASRAGLAPARGVAPPVRVPILGPADHFARGCHLGTGTTDLPGDDVRIDIGSPRPKSTNQHLSDRHTPPHFPPTEYYIHDKPITMTNVRGRGQPVARAGQRGERETHSKSSPSHCQLLETEHDRLLTRTTHVWCRAGHHGPVYAP